MTHGTLVLAFILSFPGQLHGVVGVCLRRGVGEGDESMARGEFCVFSFGSPPSLNTFVTGRQTKRRTIQRYDLGLAFHPIFAAENTKM